MYDTLNVFEKWYILQKSDFLDLMFLFKMLTWWFCMFTDQ